MEIHDILKTARVWLATWLRDRGFLLAMFGVFVGAAISFFVSRHYYEKSGEELAAETARLRELHNFTLIVLQNMQAGPHVKSIVERDKNGVPKGIGVSIGSDPLISNGSANGGEATGN